MASGSTLAGTDATAVLALDSEASAPPLGAALVNSTVPLAVWDRITDTLETAQKMGGLVMLHETLLEALPDVDLVVV